MTSAAPRIPQIEFFVPKNDFQVLLGDHAVVQKTSTQIRHGKTHAGTGCNRSFLSHQHTFAKVLSELPANPAFPFATEGQLVFADVDDENPKHEEEISQNSTKTVPANVESDDVGRARESLIEHLATQRFEHEDRGEGENYEVAKQHLAERIAQGVLDPDIMEYIIRAQTRAEQTKLLKIMSGQTIRLFPRRVLVLVGLIDDMQNTKIGVNRGWRIGYDLVHNVLIIKPFLSAEKKHPLGGSWTASAQEDDKISFSDKSTAFAKHYIDAAKQINKEVDAQSPLTSVLKSLVHTMAAQWISRNSILQLIDVQDVEPFEEAIATHIKRLARVKFPVKSKLQDHDASGRRPSPVLFFVRMQHDLENAASLIHDYIQQREEEGDHEEGVRVANVYSSMMDTLIRYNEAPVVTDCWHAMHDAAMKECENQGGIPGLY